MSEAIEPEIWSNETVAEFLVNNSVDEEEYRFNLQEVLALGIDPLALNPDHLFRENSWQRAEAHQDVLPIRRRS